MRPMTEEKLITMSTRMDHESLQYIEKISRKFQLDRSTALRRLLSKGIKADKKESAVELYLNGKLSLEGAAAFSDLSIGEFLQVLKEKGVELNVTKDDYLEGLRNLRISK